jgi:hypothetical protein
MGIKVDFENDSKKYMKAVLKEEEKKNSEVKKNKDEPEPDPLGKFGD